MASVNPLLTSIGSGKTVRDYKHASRTFVDNNYELQPKYSNLFHVVFEFTPDAATLFDTTAQLEIPILVKSTDLPAYTLDVQTHNQYNRKTQSHHGFQYQPVTIRFHDDAKEIIRNLWHKYYTFYNADPTYDLDGNSYTTGDKYSNRTQQQWGLQRGNKRFFKNIKIYSMHNHKFAEYTLINPVITSFNHDNHAYANGGLMENTMQVAYETVKYATGYVNDITPRGFADIHYDVETSDLSASTIAENTAFINGTLQNVSGQNPSDLFQGNIIGTITDAEIIMNQTKTTTTGNILTDTLAIFTNNLLTGKKPTSNILVPITAVFENTASNISKGITDNIADTVTEYLSTSSNQSTGGGKVLGDGVILSQGKIIQTRNNISNSSNYDVGFANKVPADTGTKSNPDTISATRTYIKNSSSLNNNKVFSKIVDTGT